MVPPLSGQLFGDEKQRIVERIKDFIKNEGTLLSLYFVMLRNGRILYNVEYYDMVSAGEISPQDAYVYVKMVGTPSKSSFYYPFLFWYGDLVNAYLSKQGFYYGDFIVPTTGLKYVALAVNYFRKYYLSIELLNLDTAVDDTNLRMITFEVLGEKLISGEKGLTKDEYNKIRIMYESQRLFAGYNVGEASNIIHKYYDKDKKSLVKEVARIVIDYDRIFQPYRVCYETRTWKEVDYLSIKLD